jgi:hypothetical protein
MMEQYMPAITMALLGVIVFTAGMILIVYERMKLRRKADQDRRGSAPNTRNPAEAGS